MTYEKSTKFLLSGFSYNFGVIRGVGPAVLVCPKCGLVNPSVGVFLFFRFKVLSQIKSKTKLLINSLDYNRIF